MTLALFLLTHLLNQGGGTYAFPIISRDDSNVTTDGPAFATSTSCTDINNCRTVSDIVWSCLSVIVACTWAALHRDIPPPGISWYISLANHVWTTIVAFFTPEFMAFMAIMEFEEALEWKRKFQNLDLPSEARWGLTHAFFAIMGGFKLAKPKPDGQVGYDDVGALSPAMLHKLAKAGRVDLSLITEDVINDKSKGDLISKGFVVLQTTWFIIQILARFIQHLAVTELEIVTLAFAVLNFLTYGFWSKKPIEVGTPITLVLLPAKEERESKFEDGGSGMAIEDLAAASTFMVEEELRKDREGAEDPEKELTPTDVFRDLLSLLYKYRPNLFRDPFGSVRAVITNLSRSGAPTGTCLVLTVVTTIFGGLHFIAWGFLFPTDIERWTWRAATMVITAAPPYMFLGRHIAVFVIDRVFHADPKGVWRRVGLGVATVLATLPGSVLYTNSRSALIILSLMELRKLPASALETVSWTRFIPHV